MIFSHIYVLIRSIDGNKWRSFIALWVYFLFGSSTDLFRWNNISICSMAKTFRHYWAKQILNANRLRMLSSYFWLIGVGDCIVWMGEYYSFPLKKVAYLIQANIPSSIQSMVFIHSPI